MVESSRSRRRAAMWWRVVDLEGGQPCGGE